MAEREVRGETKRERKQCLPAQSIYSLRQATETLKWVSEEQQLGG